MIGDFFNQIVQEEEQLEKEKGVEVPLEEEQHSSENTIIKDEKTEVEDLDNPIAVIMQEIADKDIFPIDTEKEYTPDEEGFQELILDGVNNKIAEVFSERPDLSSLVDIVQNGGTLGELFERMGGVSYSDLDVEDVDTQEQIVIDYYSSKGLKPEKIQKLITDAKDSNTFSEEFNNAYQELVNNEKLTQQNYLKELQEENKRLQEESIAQIENLKTTIYSTEEIQGFKLDKKTKDQFFNYLTKPVTKGKTQLQIDSENEDSQLKMAWMYFTNFNAKDLEKKISTNLTEKLEKAVKLSKTKTITKASSKSNQGRREEEEDPFANVLFPN